MSSVFPVLIGQRNISDTEVAIDSEPGLTKRELFAAMAMQGMLASDIDKTSQFESMATCAVGFADALVAALSKEPKP